MSVQRSASKAASRVAAQVTGSTRARPRAYGNQGSTGMHPAYDDESWFTRKEEISPKQQLLNFNNGTTRKEEHPKTEPLPVLDEGWSTVSSSKKATQTTGRSIIHRQTPASNMKPRQGNSPSSVGPYARSKACGGGSRVGYMKESCLPVDERDSERLAAEENKGRVYAKELYRVGMIFRAVHHEPHYNQGNKVDITNKYRTETRCYGVIESKFRKFIVIGLLADHYIAIPVYSYQGTGIAEKSRPDEFVSVRDHRIKEKHPAQSKHQPLKTEVMNSFVDPIHPLAVAHITYSVSRSYSYEIIQEGRLTKAATKQLVDLFNDYAPKMK
ncbi:MAG: hypothetical protein M1827_007154 [Pycnora praestabilis]|nr:MAG: hypothetical protein M1827_007154 [Pycnora praestabilis]